MADTDTQFSQTQTLCAINSNEDQAAVCSDSARTDGLPEPLNLKWVKGILIAEGVNITRVYLGLNSETGSLMAVKQFELPKSATDPVARLRLRGMIANFVNENRVLKDLDHPHIVQYLGWVVTPGYLTLLLEYVSGGTIASCLASYGPFEEDMTRSFALQILSGLEYLHSRGIVHKDIRSGSVLVEQQGTCKISHFAFSEKTESLQETAGFTPREGKIFWMPPEAIKIDPNKGYNTKLDIWSFGCVVLEMWTGSRPWNGLGEIPVMFKLAVEKAAPPMPEDININEVGHDFRRACFERDPDMRFSAAELRQHPYLALPKDWKFNGFGDKQMIQNNHISFS